MWLLKIISNLVVKVNYRYLMKPTNPVWGSLWEMDLLCLSSKAQPADPKERKRNGVWSPPSIDMIFSSLIHYLTHIYWLIFKIWGHSYLVGISEDFAILLLSSIIFSTYWIIRAKLIVLWIILMGTARRHLIYIKKDRALQFKIWETDFVLLLSSHIYSNELFPC